MRVGRRGRGRLAVNRPRPEQLRAGRILAGMNVRELAAAARLSEGAVRNLERGRTKVPREATLMALCDALARRGVEFAPGGWVRLRSVEPNVTLPIEGVDALAQVMTLLDVARRLLNRNDVDISGIRIGDPTQPGNDASDLPPRLRYDRLPLRRPGRE